MNDPQSGLRPPPLPRRYLAVWFPFLPTDRFHRQGLAGGRRDEPPLVLVVKEKGGLRITALDRAASRLDLRIGMTLAQARGQCTGLIAEPADAAADARALLRLGETCEMFTPLVGLSPPDGLVLDITGCAHLFGGESDLRHRIGQRLLQIGFTPRIAIAGTPDAARTFARFDARAVVAPGKEAEAAASLPIAALECTDEIATALGRAGLKTLGELAARPSQMLSARFGADLVTRLNRIMGHEDIRITPLRVPPDVMIDRHLPAPIMTVDAGMAVLDRLAGDICRQLEMRGVGGQRFEAVLFRTDGMVRRLSIETAQPTRERASLMRLFRLRLDALADPLDPGFGFDALRLSVLISAPMPEQQRQLDGGTDDDAVFTDLIDRLVARLGSGSVFKFIACDSHDPARAAMAVPVAARLASSSWVLPEVDAPPLRPLTLFEPPQRIEDAVAEVPDAPPRRFRWRRVLHEVIAAEGPERIAPEWWRDDVARMARDYYRVEDAEGRRFWLFREGFYEDAAAPPRWFLHGLFA